MAGRKLTPGETDLARSIYGSQIDYTKVLIFDEKWKFFMPSDRAHAPNGNIYFPGIGGAKYFTDFSAAPLDNKSTFIHEMGHVWQHQRGLNVIVRAALKRNYDYSEVFTTGDYFALGMEQQAEFLSDYYLLKNGVIMPDKPDKSEFDRVMPKVLGGTTAP
ncbi:MULTISPECIES: hypothetical protein [unclassified Phyllobacterium]|uniref:hypothetical protein n=1 Tax=Phyllobacterium TaxID=28100 RepID=UPI000DD769B0|nr:MULTISPECIES: hypothetical protein [unclassified Phyllobacterium]MBA8899714.1 hypothetical protein [Phyllobacterium sp. P30BS-XVII]UGX85708.1 hypothetical protein LLE53_014825 [Phyllobacterium sp. T1293]